MPASLNYKFMRRRGSSFALGFEMGQFWERCEQCRPGKRFEFVYHLQNEGEILRVATHFGVIRNDWTVDGESHHGMFFR